MNNNESMIGPTLGAWIVAALAGGLASVLLWLLGDWSFMQGAFAGAVVFFVVGAICMWIMRPLPAPGHMTSGDTATPSKPASRPVEATVAPAAATAADVAAEPAPQPDVPQTPQTPQPAPEATPVAEAAPVAEPAATSESKPELFVTPQGDADDLKLISGVGPKLEGTLNELGVWHFTQIASWHQQEIEWVDARLRFKGRIERDDWIGQAKTLAQGGETEFSKRKKK